MRWLRSFAYVHRTPEIWRCVRMCKRPFTTIGRYLGGSRGEYPILIELRNGLSFEIRDFHDLVTAWVVFFRREYRPPQNARTILDLGANIGCFTVFSALSFPSVRLIAVEPFPSTFRRLEENVRRHGLDKRVVLREFGIGSSAGRRLMASGGPSQSRGTMPVGQHQMPTTPVSVVSLEELLRDACQTWGVETIDFVKIDVEGAEHEAILACPTSTLSRIQHLGMEYHPNQSKQPLFERLECCGLRLTHDEIYGPNIGVAHFSRRP